MPPEGLKEGAKEKPTGPPREAPTPPRRPPPELFDRFAAKAIDTAVWLLLAMLLRPAGALFGVLFWLLCDGLWSGASPGKHAVGLMVLHKDLRRPATLKESALRNIPMALPALLLLLPFGHIICAVVGVPVILLESYFLITDPDEARLGDIFADTRVVSIKAGAKRKTGKRIKAPFAE